MSHVAKFVMCDKHCAGKCFGSQLIKKTRRNKFWSILFRKLAFFFFFIKFGKILHFVLLSSLKNCFLNQSLQSRDGCDAKIK